MVDLYPQIPRLALGTFDNIGDAATNQVANALEIGYRHIDTAQVYGNEESVGAAIQATTIPRNELFITSKVWITRYRDVRESVLESVQKLKSEYIDLMLLHFPISFKNQNGYELDNVSLQTAWEQLEQCKDQGLIRHIGVSNWPFSTLVDTMSYASEKPAVNQIEIHPYYPQKLEIDNMFRVGVLPFAYAPIGAPNKPFDVDPDAKVLLQDPVVNELAVKYSISPGQVLINFGLQRNYGVVAKATAVERLRDNFTASQTALSQEDLDRLLGIEYRIKYYNLILDGYKWKLNQF